MKVFSPLAISHDKASDNGILQLTEQICPVNNASMASGFNNYSFILTIIMLLVYILEY